MSRLAKVPGQLHAVATHPLNRDRPFRAIGRWLRWQIGSRLVPGDILVPFVDDTVLVARPGLTGVTGNIYNGLDEYEDMAFALHLLRPGDIFVDVGANCGSYTILASGAAGATAIAFEPVPATADLLDRNVRVNGLTGRVMLHRCGVAAEPGSLPFTTDQDTTNHVAAAGEPSEMIPVESLDHVLTDAAPTLIKIDVEGFEAEVLRGASGVLKAPNLRALIVEISGGENPYGGGGGATAAMLADDGFGTFVYVPASRELVAAPMDNRTNNTLFVRDPEWVQKRLRSAPDFRVGGRSV